MPTAPSPHAQAARPGSSAPLTSTVPPLLARRLGYLGLLPFVLGAALVWFVEGAVRPHVLLAVSAYAAVIVTFLGAVHWGLGMVAMHPSPRLFGWAVTPGIFAWIAVMMQPSAGLVVHGVMLVACYAVDRKVFPVHGAAAWLTLRFRLSAVASLCCFIAAAGA